MGRSFWSLLSMQSIGLTIDNAAKLMLMALAIAVLPPAQAGPLKSLLAVLMILPAILLAPIVGWLADRHSKQEVIRAGLWMQMAILIIISAGLTWGRIEVAVLGFFLLGIQMAVLSPAKQGIIRELVPAVHLPAAVGWIEVTAIASILLGTLLGGACFDWCFALLGDGARHAYIAGLITTALLALLAGVALIYGYRIEHTPAQTREPFSWAFLWRHFGHLKQIARIRPVWLSILGNSYFYALAGALFLTLLEVSQIYTGAGPGTGTRTGIYMLLIGGGVIAGSFLVTYLAPQEIEIGLIPFGSLGLIVSALLLAFLPPDGPAYLYEASLVLLGLCGAFFVVPLNAHLQHSLPPEVRGRAMAVNNLVLNVTSVVGIGIQYLLAQVWLVSPAGQFLFYAASTTILTIAVTWLLPENTLRFALKLLIRTFYRIDVRGRKSIPTEGGVLLLPNHLSYVDALVLIAVCPRRIRFLIWEEFHSKAWMAWCLRLFQTIPISPQRARGGLQAAADALARGEVVCLFPEGKISRTATLDRLQEGYRLLLKNSPAHVVPVWLENLWGSIFSYRAGKILRQWPARIPYPVWVRFGEPIPSAAATPAAVRQALYELGADAFAARPELGRHLGRVVFAQLRKRPFRCVMTDTTLGGKSLRAGTLLATALALAQELRRLTTRTRVGIVLPPGIGAMLCNAACVFAGKTPVNLNFTAGADASRSALTQSGVDLILSADALRERLPDFPWQHPGVRTLDVKALAQKLPRWKIAAWGLAALLLPSPVGARLAGIPAHGGGQEAGLLFTSGSTAEPKGVPLSHRNLLANLEQIDRLLGTQQLSSLLACLPIFHSFGFTVTLWWPLTTGPAAVACANPLETQRLLEVIEKYKIELVLTTPTLLRGYLRKAEPSQFSSVRLVVTGAEKLPVPLSEQFQAHFGMPVCEGYGMTEAAPVVSVNLPDVPPSPATPDGIKGTSIGSAGRLAPGVAVRIRHPETRADLSIFESGMVWLKGANLFSGYLNAPADTADAIEDDWYRTGDLGRLDEDGFLYIEGRVSRFSKIGGEMVSHAYLEQKITDAFELPTESLPTLAVVGVPDARKGEALILLAATAFPEKIDAAALRERLVQAGVPALWIPRQLLRIDALPVMANGKLDLRQCQSLALERSTTTELASNFSRS